MYKQPHQGKITDLIKNMDKIGDVIGYKVLVIFLLDDIDTKEYPLDNRKVSILYDVANGFHSKCMQVWRQYFIPFSKLISHEYISVRAIITLSSVLP